MDLDTSVILVVLFFISFLVSLQPELPLLAEFPSQHSQFPVCSLSHQTFDGHFGEIYSSYSEQRKNW